VADTYIVVAPLALVKRTNGTVQYCYQGTPVPQDAAPGEVERLVVDGFIALDAVFAVPVGGVIPVVVDGDGNPADPARAAAVDPGLLNVRLAGPAADPATDPAADVVDPVAPAAGDKPRGNASEQTWRDYHATQLQAQGTTEEDAKAQAAAMSRDDIRKRYTTE
jgi:hypothetical protein